jgi:hypothetical protein
MLAQRLNDKERAATVLGQMNAARKPPKRKT